MGSALCIKHTIHPGGVPGTPQRVTMKLHSLDLCSLGLLSYDSLLVGRGWSHPVSSGAGSKMMLCAIHCV